jgi:Tol biopolymer transport system component
MGERPRGFRSLVAELRQRHVFRVAGLYAAVAWLVIQAASTILPRLDLPDWSVTLVIVLALFGFPLALVLAWSYDLTPDGVRRADALPVESAPRSAARLPSGGVLLVIAVVAVAAGMSARHFRDDTVRLTRIEREAWSAEGLPVVRFTHALPAGQSFTALSHNLVALSPDGATLVYEADGRLYRRAMAEFEASVIRGTEGSPASPFFSPDGHTIAYWDAASAELRRISISGGAPVTITRATVLYGGSWEADGTILFGQEDGIWRVSASGGTPELVVAVESGELVYGPSMLPDGGTLMFAITRRAAMFGQNTAWDSARVAVQSLRTGERREILRGGDARYVPTGHLVYALDQNLYAVPFDAARQEVRGGPEPVVEGVGRTGRGSRGLGGGANYAFGASGSLVYVPAGGPRAGHPRQLLGVDLEGNAVPLIEEERDYWRPRISPDGSRVAVEVAADGARQIWIVHLASRTATPLAVAGENNYPVWTADGEWVVYNSNRGGVIGTWRQRADGSGEPELLVEDTWPTDASGEGVLSLRATSQAGAAGVLTYDLRDGSLTDFVVTNAREHMARFSPDGRWLAYTSNESGRDEVYVRPYPRTEGVARLVSLGGGAGPVWAPDGATLYYRGEAGDIMAVRTTTSPTFTAGRPQPVFRYLGRFRMSGTDVAYDIDPAGSRFIMVSELDDPTWFASRINIVQNWFAELNQVR